MKKPPGIVIIAVLNIINGGLFIIAGTMFAVFSGMQETPEWYKIFGAIIGILGAILYASVYGLWTLQKWGWFYTRNIYILSIIIEVIALLPGSKITSGSKALDILQIGIDIAIIIYLSKEEIKKIYGLGNIEEDEQIKVDEIVEDDDNEKKEDDDLRWAPPGFKM